MASTREQRQDPRLLETRAIVVAYAMSRLNQAFLREFNFPSWRRAFSQCGERLDVPPASMKNLRDEFDPVHGFRRGWHKRPLRPNRQRVLSAFCELSGSSLLDIATQILAGDEVTTDEVVTPLALATERLENVAERLRTGRLAEQYFLENTLSLCGITPDDLVDHSNDATGYDFGVKHNSGLAIEAKGLKPQRGPILFTNRE